MDRFFGPRAILCGRQSVFEAQGTSESDSRPLGLKNALASAQNRSQSEKSIQVPSILRTKTIFNRKIYPSTLILPHQTHLRRPLGFKNALASAEAQGTSESDSRPLGLKNALASAQNRSRSEKSPGPQKRFGVRAESLPDVPWALKTLWRARRIAPGRNLGFKNAPAVRVESLLGRPLSLKNASGVRVESLLGRPLDFKNALASA